MKARYERMYNEYRSSKIRKLNYDIQIRIVVTSMVWVLYFLERMRKNIMGVIEVFYIVDFGSLYTYVKIYQCVHVDLCILLNVDYNSILRMKK